MKEIPLKAVERQSLSILLDAQLFDIAIKECNGIMAATIARDGVTLVSNRRICAGVYLIPEGHLEQGNFVFVTDNNNIPYYSNFASTDVLLYISAEELEQMRSQAGFDNV